MDEVDGSSACTDLCPADRRDFVGGKMPSILGDLAPQLSKLMQRCEAMQADWRSNSSLVLDNTKRLPGSQLVEAAAAAMVHFQPAPWLGPVLTVVLF